VERKTRKPRIIQEIPSGKYRYNAYVQFVRDYKRDQRGTEIEGSGVSWLVFGPAELVVPREVAEVKRMDEGITFVQVLDILAERVVKKRNNTEVRYVLATFDNCVEEDTNGTTSGNTKNAEGSS